MYRLYMFLPLVVFPKHLSFAYTREDWCAPHMHCYCMWERRYYINISQKDFLQTLFIAGVSRLQLNSKCAPYVFSSYIYRIYEIQGLFSRFFFAPSQRICSSHFTHVGQNQQKQIDFDYDKDMCLRAPVCTHQQCAACGEGIYVCCYGTRQNKDLIQLKKMKQFWFNASVGEQTTIKAKKKHSMGVGGLGFGGT